MIKVLFFALLITTLFVDANDTTQLETTEAATTQLETTEAATTQLETTKAAGTTTTPAPIPDCYSNPDCPVGEECLAGTCKVIVGGCIANGDCPVDKECVAGTCKAIAAGCSANADCPMDKECVAGTCEAIVAPPPTAPQNEEYVIEAGVSLTVGDNDDTDVVAEVTATAYAAAVGVSMDAVAAYGWEADRRSRRLLSGQSGTVNIKIVTTDSNQADSIVATASSNTFSSTLESGMQTAATDLGVTVTVESLSAEPPTRTTVVTGCAAFKKRDCQKESKNCAWDRKSGTCLVRDGCASIPNKRSCKKDHTCEWNGHTKLCFDKSTATGCEQFTKKKFCFDNDSMLCQWLDGQDQCVSVQCSELPKKKCKKRDECIWGYNGSNERNCADVPSS